MDIRQLRYFIAIAEEGSLSAAAQRVGVAQPSLSQHVLHLEQTLGVRLLERSPRGVTLTQSGALLLTHSRGIVAAMEDALREVRESGNEPRGEVTFGLPSSISMVLSVPLAETVRVELPKVRLRAMEAMSGFIESWLETRHIDLGMLYDIDRLRHFTHRLLVTEELHFFSAPDAWPFRSRAGSPVRLSDLAAIEMVLPSPQHGLRKMIDRFAQAAGVSLCVTTEMDALGQIKIMVARGSAYTILSPAAAIDFVDRGELIMAPIVEPRMTRPVYLVRNPARPQTLAMREMERVTIAVIRDLVARGIWQAEELDPAQ